MGSEGIILIDGDMYEEVKKDYTLCSKKQTKKTDHPRQS